MTNKETVDAWVRQKTYTGKNSTGSLFFIGSILFSYGEHFPIAKLDIDNGVCLFTTKGYRKTTACHKGLARRALAHTTFTVILCDNLFTFNGKVTS